MSVCIQSEEKSAAVAQERICVLVVEKNKQLVVTLGRMRSVLRNHRGESFLVTKPAIVPNPSKCIPVVGEQKKKANDPLSCVSPAVSEDGEEKQGWRWKRAGHTRRRINSCRKPRVALHSGRDRRYSG